MDQQEFKEGRDYYFNEQGYMVLTERFLKERGYCCSMGCLHCPYKKNSSSPEEGSKNNPEITEDGLENAG